ncbi:MAG TPA: sulfite exporter TauE/SafE family protein [Acidimicrobiia bacterium]|nr:sulfite exporter TauE/SafE family protein [Acidimicrobiia bacterium]
MELLAATAVAVGVAAQAVTGFGFSLVSAPFLIAAYRAPTGVQLNLLLSMAVNVAVLAREHHHADHRAAGLLLAPAVVAIVPAAYAVRHVARGPLTVAAGVVCLAAVVALGSGRRLHQGSGRAATAAVGLLSGAMNVVAGISGPPVVLFALNADWPPARTRPTMQLFFLGLNALTLLSLGPPHHLPPILLLGFAAGWLAARLYGHRPSPTAVQKGTLLLAAAGSAIAILRGLTT